MNAERAGPGPWAVVWHQARWDLTRMRWWIAMIVATMALAVVCALRGYAIEFSWVFGLVEWLLILVLGVTLVQGDSPLEVSAFYRGRPIPWWTMPAAKLLGPFLVLAATAAALSIAPLLQFDESMRERLMHFVGIVAATAILVALGFAWGAVATNITNFVGVAIAVFFLSTYLTFGLQRSEWPGIPVLGPIAVGMTAILAIELYRRKWRVQRAVLTFVSLCLLGAALQTKGRTRHARHLPPLRDSVLVVIDSVTLEQPHVARVAFHAVAPPGADLLRIDDKGIASDRTSASLGLVGIGMPSNVLVHVDPSPVARVSFSRADGKRTAMLSKVTSESGSSGQANRDFTVLRSGVEVTRRVQGVAVLAMLDSGLVPSATISFEGQVLAIRATREAVLPSTSAGRARINGAEWRIGPAVEAPAVTAESRGAGARVWQLERRTLGVGIEEDDSALWFGSAYALRVRATDSLTLSSKWFADAGGTRQINVVPGLLIRSQEMPLARWPLSTTPGDSVEVYRLDLDRKLGFRARYVIPDGTRKLQ